MSVPGLRQVWAVWGHLETESAEVAAYGDGTMN